MTLHTFQLLSPTDQLALLLEEGTFLAPRWEEGSAISLYYLSNKGHGFFAEVAYDSYEQGTVLRGFSDSVPLENYVHGVQLPGE